MLNECIDFNPLLSNHFYTKAKTMKIFLTIALLSSFSFLAHAQCSCPHSAKDHINTSDARATGKEVENKTQDAANDLREGIKKTAQNVKEDLGQAKDAVANSKTVQSAQDAAKCLCDTSKCAMHKAKEKTKDLVAEGKDIAERTSQFGKEVMTTAGNTVKETVLKVVDDVKEGAMEVKGDYQRAKERSKRS